MVTETDKSNKKLEPMPHPPQILYVLMLQKLIKEKLIVPCIAHKSKNITCG